MHCSLKKSNIYSQRVAVKCYIVGFFLLYIQHVSSQACPNSCSGHGQCNNPDRVCSCFNGYIGADCSLMECPYGYAWADEADHFTGTDKAHNLAECSNRGLCDRTTGICSCESERFEGSACERKSCPAGCNFHGKCMSMEGFAAIKDLGEVPVLDRYTYSNVWDADMMYGCVCDEGYFGPDCNIRDCPKGDDPMTGGVDDPGGVQYYEKQLLTCSASGGTFTLAFRGETTAPISYRASVSEFQEAFEALSTVTNTYYTATEVSFDASEACSLSGNKIRVSFLQDFADVPMIVADASLLTMSVSTSTASIKVSEIQEGTRENDHCSNRGLCDYSTGVCTCSTGYDTSDGDGGEGRRGDCGYKSGTITTCPGETSCSGHGVCAGTPTYECACSNGYMGADCSLRTCSYGKSWFSLPSNDETAHAQTSECSDMGTCDRAGGQCTCMDGFEGGACETMSCPGDPACSAHGSCMTMSELAEVSEVNEVVQGYTYGATPNEPYTWDYEMVQGCHCDYPYIGYDCSLYECPYGDDPYTVNMQYNEIQKLTCEYTQTTGVFTLTFRGATTASISVGATAYDMEQAIEAISGDLNYNLDVALYVQRGVKYSLEDDAASQDTRTQYPCDESQFFIEYLYPTGDVPLMTIATTGATVTIDEDQKGSKEWVECSDRGLCDRATGNCLCFDGFGASDGQGNDGSIPNCGYVEPIAAVTA